MGVLFVFMFVTGLSTVSAAQQLLKEQPHIAAALRAFGGIYFGSGLAGLLFIGAVQLYDILLYML